MKKKKYTKASDDKRYAGIYRYNGKKANSLVIMYKEDGKSKIKTLGDISLEEAYHERQRVLGKYPEPLIDELNKFLQNRYFDENFADVEEYLKSSDIRHDFISFYQQHKTVLSFNDIAMLFIIQNGIFVHN